MNKETVCDVTKCTGCTSCFNICPKQCIKMIENEEGFLYPKIDLSKCISCKKCEQACPVINVGYAQNYNNKAYAAINKDERTRNISSSGGIFSIICEYIISQGGVVFAAFLEGDSCIKHIMVDSLKDIKKIVGSKYIQSDLKDTFSKVKDLLESNKMVLFSGTPCQINGLRQFLKKDYEKLYCQDIICHGISAVKVWKKILFETEKNVPVYNINFRDKSNGWTDFGLSYTINGQKKFLNKKQSIFYKLYLNNLILRTSCYNCVAKFPNIKSDITIGDFWGKENFELKQEFGDNGGITLVIINSVKGQRIMEYLKTKTIYQEVNYEDSISFNKPYTMPIKYNAKRKVLFDRLDECSIVKMSDELTKENGIVKIIKYYLNIITWEFRRLSMKKRKINDE